MTIKQKLLAGLFFATFLALLAGCGGDSDTSSAEQDESPTAAATATSAPGAETATTGAEAPPTATTAPTAEPTETPFLFDDIENPQEKDSIDRICFAAVVEWDGFNTISGVGILTGELYVPGFEEALSEVTGVGNRGLDGADEISAFLELVAPICEEIGWTP
jgi:hypothetical protein